MERMCPLGLGLGGQFNETVKHQSVSYIYFELTQLLVSISANSLTQLTI